MCGILCYLIVNLFTFSMSKAWYTPFLYLVQATFIILTHVNKLSLRYISIELGCVICNTQVIGSLGVSVGKYLRQIKIMC